MKLTKRLITRFNQPDTILVLSKYPYLDIAHSYHGVAKYTEQTLSAVAKQTGQKFVVLVQQEYDREPQLLEKGSVLVLPIFDNSLKMYSQIWSALRQFNQAKHIHIHSEFYTSGDMTQMATALLFLQSVKLSGRFISYFAHNVIADFSFIAKHLGRKSTSRLFKALQLLLPLYYKLLGLSVNQIVCLDESVRQRLSKHVSQHKLVLSPLWIYPKQVSQRSRNYWRNKLGYKKDDIVLVVFGFMTRYKGVDWLVDAVEKLQQEHQWQHIHLILAGGKAPSQTGKKHYEDFYKQLEQKAANAPSISLTGFLADKEISRYFSIADVVVLPYRGILGASASWGEGIAYGKPFILSTDLSDYLNSTDVQSLLQKHELTTENILFNRNRNSLANHIATMLTPEKRQTMAAFAADLAQLRSPEMRVGLELEHLYTSQPQQKPLEWQYALAKVKKLVPQFAS